MAKKKEKTTRPPTNNRNPGVIADVAISNIVTDDRHDRVDALLTEKSIEPLAASMAQAGLLQPIRVTKDATGSMRLVFGRRRLMAAKHLGWDTIRAEVVEWDSHIESEILQDREIENLHRQDLNPIEEAIAVANLLDVLRPEALRSLGLETGDDAAPEFARKVKAEAVRLAAERIAKDERWVRDRDFLGRLDGKARDMVLAGRLPLAHAREIAKLADPGERLSAAERFAARDGQNPAELREVRDHVARNLLSLKTVPWKLDAVVGGKQPCESCPHNSSNNPGLFDSGGHHAVDARFSASGRTDWADDEPASGVCTLKTCFDSKAAFANRKVAALAGKYVREQGRLPEKDRVPPTPKAVAPLVPPEIVPRAVADAAKDRWDAATAPAAASSRPAPTPMEPAAPTPLQIAEADLEEELSRWRRAAPKALLAALKSRPLHALYLCLLGDHKLVREGLNASAPKAEKLLSRPGAARLIGALGRDLEIGDFLDLAKDYNMSVGQALLEDAAYERGSVEFFRRASVALGLFSSGTIKEVPKLEDFLPKSEAKKPAAGAEKPVAKAGKQAAPAKARASSAKAVEAKCGTCGRGEAELRKAKVAWATDARKICDECVDDAMAGVDA